MGAVTSDVTKGPDGLLSHIGLRAGKELDENGDSASLNDDLGLGGRARRNVGQGPSSLELHQGVGGSQELDEAADDTGLDDLLDGRVPLLGQKLSELGGGLDLEIDLVGEDARNHLRKILIQLFGTMLASALTISTLFCCFKTAMPLLSWIKPAELLMCSSQAKSVRAAPTRGCGVQS